MKATSREWIDTAKNYFASCWVMKDIESYFMWSSYSNYNEGLLIFTTIGKLLDSLELRTYADNSNLVHWFYGEVDYERNRPMSTDHIRAFGKDKYFEEEKEFRIVSHHHPACNENYTHVCFKSFDFIEKIVCSPGSCDDLRN